MKKSKVLVVVNLSSRAGKNVTLWPLLKKQIELRFLDREFDFFETREDDRGRQCVRRSLVEGVREIWSVGGDGTFSEVIQGLFDDGRVLAENVQLAVIPLGRGNDFFKSLQGLHSMTFESLKNQWGLTWSQWKKKVGSGFQNQTQTEIGIPASVHEALNWIEAQSLAPLDLVKIDWKYAEPLGESNSVYMANVTSFGFPGRVVERTQKKMGWGEKWNWSLKIPGLGSRMEEWSHQLNQGPQTYVFHSFLSLFEYQPLEFDVRVDGDFFYTGPIYSGFVLNGRFNAGGIEWFRDAKTSDGKLDLVLTPSLKNLTTLAVGGVLPEKNMGWICRRGTVFEVDWKGGIANPNFVPQTEKSPTVKESSETWKKPHPLFEVDGDQPENDQVIGAKFTILPSVVKVFSKPA